MTPRTTTTSEKTFLGESGNFNGEEIIDIIVRQPGAARFIARHLYNFFVADEPQVPAWKDTPPQDPETVKALEDEYFRSNYDIRSMLRVLFNSDFFKNCPLHQGEEPDRDRSRHHSLGRRPSGCPRPASTPWP